MYIPKKYGQSKILICPFCDRNGVMKNKQKIPVCEKHRNALFPEVKCVCKLYLEPREGKFGVYFNCISCGNKSLKDVLEMMKTRGQSPKQEIKTEQKQQVEQKHATTQARMGFSNQKKDKIISTNDVEWFS